MKNIISISIGILLLFACTQKKGVPGMVSDEDKLYLLIGSYSDGTTSGITVFDFGTGTGEVKYISDIKEIINPSYLVISPDEQFVYSVNETSKGGVSAFKFDKATGALSLLNSVTGGGADPCYININRGATFITTADYSGGSVSVFPLNKEGTIEPLSQQIDLNNDNEENTPLSHIHTVVFPPGQHFLYATDLGKDKIYPFIVEEEEDEIRLELDTSNIADLIPGSGPRHLEFHPNGKYLYCINEISGMVTVFKYNRGIGEAIQYIASDVTPGEGGKGSADIHISPDGRFLYSSNRLKEDGIAIFNINSDNGLLNQVGYQSTGIHPRNFIMTPDGDYLLCANQNSDNVQIFKRDKETGLLSNTGKEIKVEKPVCLKWVSKK